MVTRETSDEEMESREMRKGQHLEPLDMYGPLLCLWLAVQLEGMPI